MFQKIFYNKAINKFLRNTIKPISKVLPESLKFPINGTFLVEGNNVKPFLISTNPTSCVTKNLFWGNIEGFEFSSVKIFCELVKSSSVFFDIGSNIGYYSLLASSINKNNIVVHAFEPMPSAFDYLTENIKINNFNNIIPHKLALSDNNGNATFYSIINEKFSQFPQLTGDGGLSANQSGKRSKVNFEVQINTLDDFANSTLGNQKIDLIKLDTEANEHFVLKGADHVLSFHKPIIQCEILKDQIETELETILANYNYLYYRCTNNGLVKVINFKNNNTEFVDYYLVPKERENEILKFVIN